MGTWGRIDVHASGICERNFDELAVAIQGYMNINRHDLALQQLARCAIERERDMNYYRTVRRPNKNLIDSKHQYVIDRVRGLMEKIEIGLRIGVTSNEWTTAKLHYHGNYFVLKYKPEHLDTYHEIKRTTTERINPSPPRLSPRTPTPPRVPTPPRLSPRSSSRTSSQSSSSDSNKKKITKSMKRRLKKKLRKSVKKT
jgi:hypothetical protein